MNEVEMETVNHENKEVPGSQKDPKPLNSNLYSTKKTFAQGMLDVALLSANASQLKHLLKYYHYQEINAIFVIHMTCIITSIVLQVILGAVLIMNEAFLYRRSCSNRFCSAQCLNNATVLGIFIITVVNVIASSFSDSPTAIVK